MKKIIGFIVFILLITTTGFSVIGIENNNPYSILIQEKKSNTHKIGALASPDDFIIDVIQQINETMYLGYLENITAFESRYTNTSQSENASEYIYNEFLSMGLDVRYHEWSLIGWEDRNVEATLNGTLSDEIYIICAHHDTVGGTQGADDDGSGVAAVLSAAYVLSQYSFDYTIRFITFSGEEQGMLGSRRYVEDAIANDDDVNAVLNVDMIGFAINSSQGKKIRIRGEYQAWLGDLVIELGELYYDYIQLDEIKKINQGLGDEIYFSVFMGIPAICGHEYEFNYYYHTPYDNISNMNITYALKGTRLLIATLAEIAEFTVIGDPPETPILSGNDQGIIGQDIAFTVITTDPDDDNIKFLFDWGDGNFTVWIGPYDSGKYVDVLHSWNNIGKYNVRVKARDEYYQESDWSNIHTINIVDNPSLEIKKISGGLFTVKADIKNIGGIEATNVNWSITLKSGAFIGKKTDGSDLNILGGEIVTITSDIILGFGPTTIIIDAWIQGSSVEREVNGFIFLLFTKINPGG